MAVKSVSELSQELKLTVQNLYTYKGRGKLIIVDGTVDTTNPINNNFIQKRLFKLSRSGPEPNEQQETEEKPRRGKAAKPNYTVVKVVKSEKKGNGNGHSNGNGADGWDSLRLFEQLKAEKIQEEIKELKRRNAKEAGELISMEDVIKIVGIHFRNVISSFYNMADNYTSDLCNRLGADRVTLSEFRGKLKAVINETVDQAKEQSKIDLSNLTNK